MKTNVKAKGLREGDKVELDDNTIGTVRHIKTHKKIIPRRTVEQTSIELEVKSKRNGRSFVSSVHMFTHADDSLPVVDRKGYGWKWSKMQAVYGKYINVFATATTGSILATVLGATGVISVPATLTLLILTVVLTAGALIYVSD